MFCVFKQAGKTIKVNMKKSFLLLIPLLFSTLAHGYPVRISSWDPVADVQTLNSLNVSVDNVNRATGTIIVYARDDEEYTRILDSGLSAKKLPDLARENAMRLHQDQSLNAPKEGYYTISQYQQFMQDTAAQFPQICALTQIGNSVQGRPLYFLKITDNPARAEAEPEFKFISSIHGDEVVGYDMCIRLIQLLTSAYGTDQRITELVDNTEIWICPMMNPDGFVLGNRFNANWVDLNRNFPLPFGGNQHPDGFPWAQENVAMMEFCQERNFVLSANFHGGALVANYPWDHTYNLAPDNNLLIQAALAYSSHNPSMYNSTEFPQGITNGADWYVITGSMQDWNYGETDCMDITMEIGNNKWPPSFQLPTYWEENKEAMLAFMEFAHSGIHGLVTSEAGTPLDATISVQGNSKVMHTDPEGGDYHRLLLPGTYTVTASAAGYQSRTELITIPEVGETQHDFVLAFTTGIPAGDELANPAVVNLGQNHPNPFNPNTCISFHLSADQSVYLGIYNTQGRLVRTLQDGFMSRGTHELFWDGLDERGNEVGSGIYLYELISGGQRQIRRMVLLK